MEIEVTPEMRVAGANALADFSGVLDQEGLAEEVYIAMQSAKCCSSRLVIEMTTPFQAQRAIRSERCEDRGPCSANRAE